MSYQFDPREALQQVRDAAAREGPFPPPGASRLVSDAIEAFRDEGDESDVTTAEALSVLLYRLEVASWRGSTLEPADLRAAIAACGPESERTEVTPVQVP